LQPEVARIFDQTHTLVAACSGPCWMAILLLQATWDFLIRGGFVMAPIALGSIIALTFALERAWSLQRRRIVPARFVSVVRDQTQRGRIDEAMALCAANDSPIAAVLHAGLRHAGAGRAAVREAMEDRGRREAAQLERFTGILGTVATVSPLLGLLGTVTGMIETFQRVTTSVEASAQVSAGALAGGIWEALITTAAGLTVAIPALLAYRLIVSHIDRLTIEMEAIALETLDALFPPPPAGGSRDEK
jgi:biopolymer transport protein ExbB